MTMRRIRRNVDPHITPENIMNNLNSDSPIGRRGPKPCGPKPSLSNEMLTQRITVIEGEVADINVTLAKHTCEINDYETRLEKLEKASQCQHPPPHHLQYPYMQYPSYPTP